jgi:hypothetical protein
MHDKMIDDTATDVTLHNLAQPILQTTPREALSTATLIVYSMGFRNTSSDHHHSHPESQLSNLFTLLNGASEHFVRQRG